MLEKGLGMNKIVAVLCLALAVSVFAQVNSKIEYSEKYADVDYVGDGKAFHTLDIYLPKEVKDSYPVVIHTYGGAWSVNNAKSTADLNTICAALLNAGYAVVTPNHRAASDAVYPAQLHDIKAVVRFVRGNAAKFKFDTTFVAASGFSSGGHLSSLVATTCGLEDGKSGSVTVDLVGNLGEFTQYSSCVDAASLWSAPTDIYTMIPIKNQMAGKSGTFEGAFIGVERDGHKDKWMVASSPYYASEDDPPIIMFHGTKDQIVNIEQSEELYDSLKKCNVVTERIVVEGGTHGGNEMYVDSTLNKMVEFLNTAHANKVASMTASVGDSPYSVKVDFLKRLSRDYTPLAQIGLIGDKLVAYGTGKVRFAIVSMNGARAWRGSFRGSLNLSALPSGVYAAVVTFQSGMQKSLKFAKK